MVKTWNYRDRTDFRVLTRTPVTRTFQSGTIHQSSELIHAGTIVLVLPSNENKDQ